MSVGREWKRRELTRQDAISVVIISWFRGCGGLLFAGLMICGSAPMAGKRRLVERGSCGEAVTWFRSVHLEVKLSMRGIIGSRPVLAVLGSQSLAPSPPIKAVHVRVWLRLFSIVRCARILVCPGPAMAVVKPRN